MSSPQKVIVVGAGPVGSLAALYAAQRGHQVEVYDLRADLRDPTTTPLNFTKSINLALAERGMNALRQVKPGLLEEILEATVPLKGRMIHGRGPRGELYEHSQDYDAHGRTNYAIDRAGLNKQILNILEGMPNVRLLFNHKLTGADFRSHKAWFEVQGTGQSTGRAREVEVDFDFMIGADGAHSAVRYHLMKYVRMNYRQDYIDTLWCEFHLKPREGATKDDPASKFRISPNHLHIWPGKDFMFIAIPSDDGSFTCTLFMPSAEFATLEANPAGVPSFFDRHFPGVTEIIPPNELIKSFNTNPHLPLISIKCEPYHYSSSVVIVGDAAHAMVPFYGQGMNAGFEDVRILFSILDKHSLKESNAPDDSSEADKAVFAADQRALALAEYTAQRVPDAHAINELALQNYVEMRSSVLSPTYKLRKYLEEMLSVHLPQLGWQTKYARVSFGNERYSEVVRKSDEQGRILVGGFIGAVGVPVVAGAAYILAKHRRADLPTVAATLKHPSYPDATWALEPTRSGRIPVAEGRGGPFNLAWEVHGEGPIKVILIMGLAAFKTAWQRQTLYFGHERAGDYSVLLIDNRGMGDSDVPLMRYSTSDMARDALEVVRHVGFLDSPGRRLHVVGMSLGGMIAQELALLAPDRLSSLSLCCTAAAVENTGTFAEHMANRASLLIPKGLERSVRDAAHQLFSRDWLRRADEARVPAEGTPRVAPPPSGAGWPYGAFETNYQRFVAQEMHKRLDARRFTTRGFLLQLIAAGWHRKTPAQLAAMADAVGRERILVMHGTEDGMISVPHGRKLIQYIAPGTSYILEGVGHAPVVERCEWFNECLRERFEAGEKLDGRL
ncbi:uncharacterized protein E0L32_004595 [Thyridium curvatum]|uniref:Kynurenine 3-monooxygenase n=1 Tax=Thyridium curvatum TaxID=1093900 RepID=A0A507BEW2_9PEZI|nr:uncharacterized protein E0L32_004595 [Thyridium curvatum]TPX15318.1 hypothetical protein E0L32_004595 [Thyridium curvatum]